MCDIETKGTMAEKEFGFATKEGVHWGEYLAYRPVYPASFYKRIYDYHSRKPGANWSVAHDVGAGCGVVSAQLTHRFGSVIVSDPNDGYVDLARKILVQDSGIPKSKLFFLQESAEETSVDPASVDLLTACECIHWTDTHASLREFHRQLKPRGTLVITHYGVPRIVANSAAQKAWMAIWAYHSTKATSALFERVFRLCNMGLEGLRFPPSDWKNVRRMYINTHGTLEPFIFNNRIGASCVTIAEERVWQETDEDWCDVQGIEWMKGYFSTWMPKIPETEIQHLWQKLEIALGGGKVNIEFPVAMIFGTKA